MMKKSKRLLREVSIYAIKDNAMKIYKKRFIIFILVIVIGGLCIAYHAYQIRNSYYPMGGEVRVIDKTEVGSKYYIVILEPPEAKFTLSCSQEEYNLVNIGDTINCERYQSIVTHKGSVHKIKLIG